MKKALLPPLLGAFLLLASCDPYRENIIKGTLHSDSTLTVPLANERLSFYEGDYYDLVYGDSDGHYLGQAVTDDRGRWAFQYIENLDNPYRDRGVMAKVSVEERSLLIMHGEDTLYCGPGDRRSKVRLYPGCWENPTIPHHADSTRQEGGEG